MFAEVKYFRLGKHKVDRRKKNGYTNCCSPHGILDRPCGPFVKRQYTH